MDSVHVAFSLCDLPGALLVSLFVADFLFSGQAVPIAAEDFPVN